jgi:hypothetical protein
LVFGQLTWTPRRIARNGTVLEMPTRLLREGINDSLRVNALSEGAELFYRKLMSLVDDFGRYEAEPRLLHAKLYALRPERKVEDVSGFLAECSVGDYPLITVYQTGRKQFLQINNFGQRERTSKYPPPPADNESLRQSAADYGNLPRNAADCGNLPQNAAYARASTPTPNTNTSSHATANTSSTAIPPTVQTALDEAIERNAKRVHGNHPRLRRDIGSGQVATRLRAICRRKHLSGAEAALYLDALAERHELFCASREWCKDGGEFAKSLANWLAPSMERYDQDPPVSAAIADDDPVSRALELQRNKREEVA